jgi:hypothetical protein
MPHIHSQTRSAPRSAGVVHTETVVPANWPEACADFARTYHGQAVRVLTLPTAAAARGDTADAAVLGADLPLDDVAAVAAEPLPNIDIRVYGDGEPFTVQRVERPRSMALEKSVDGRLRLLRIDDTDGVTTLVRPTERRT